MTDATVPVELLVCTKCRRDTDLADGKTRPGAVLLENLKTEALPDGVTLRPIECLSNCSQGCTIALRGPDRWTYVYGNLHEVSHLDTIIDGATRYRATTDGIVPWRERPEHFRKNCIARVPPLES